MTLYAVIDVIPWNSMSFILFVIAIAINMAITVTASVFLVETFFL